ncbi:SANT/Myb domain [Sesbania bispinosa]|nr:SANT/Myb domain [Sesbania bispinosa]
MSDSKPATANNGQYVQEKRPCERAPMLEFSPQEEDLVARMFRLVGNRWSLIAGRIPGRSAEEIEKYWTSKW